MNTDLWLMLVQGLLVLGFISLGVRTGGISIGLWGGVGVLVLVAVFGLEPGAVPISAMLIILAVVAAAGAMQVAGGVQYLVSIAQRIIRADPKRVTFIAPYVSWIFTLGAGTGNVYYSLLPVIYEVSYNNKVRPEKPLAISPVASQMGITSSPVSAAMAVMVGLMAPFGFSITDILAIVVPATIVAIFCGALVMTFVGKPLEEDEEYQRRLAAGEITPPDPVEESPEALSPAARRSAWIFIAGVVAIVIFGVFPGLRPTYVDAEGVAASMAMTELIQVVMFTAAVAIVMLCKASPALIPGSKIFISGVVSVVALFGIAWMANTFIGAHREIIVAGLGSMAAQYPVAIAFALFAVAALTTSQSSTTLAIIPIGLTLGVPPQYLIAMWPAVIGIYFFPANGSQIATINLDQTGTTKIGKLVLNHSFFLPMIVCAVSAVATGFAIATLLYGVGGVEVAP
ncbi:MAG: anaerobic C4-dicarboxylate transporter family protein [Aliihoeflea sp.]